MRSLARRVGPTHAGRLGIVGGVLFAIAVVVEYTQDLRPPADGVLFYIDQLAFVLALSCWAIAVLGLHARGDAGTGRARHALPVWALAIALIAIGSLISLLLHAFVSSGDGVYDNNPLFPIGGIGSTVAALIAGIAVARAGRLHDWRRWVVLVYALYYLLALFVPLFFGAEPNIVTETIWGLAWVFVGFTLLRPALTKPVEAPVATTA